ncbi:MAG: aminodeoxychorismate/anthranilate synthase component II [Planctomycetota bacterium]|nr:aminodeoxychorismate/anthranilate synthase component II [Planctomycetota bacterium]
MILLIDNYDSFVANIARYFRRLNLETRVIRNDESSVSELSGLDPTAIVISPGPCTPKESGISIPVVKQFSGRVPILGICLGHQVIAHVAGATVAQANEPHHGRQSTLTHMQHWLFNQVPQKFDAGRYHSLAVVESTLPEEFEVICRSTDGTVMGIANDSMKLFGLQFHPESILTPFGFHILQNFTDSCGLNRDMDHLLGSLLYQSESLAVQQQPQLETPSSPPVGPHNSYQNGSWR